MEVATCLGVICEAAGRPFVTKHAAIFAHVYRIIFMLPFFAGPPDSYWDPDGGARKRRVRDFGLRWLTVE